MYNQFNQNNNKNNGMYGDNYYPFNLGNQMNNNNPTNNGTFDFTVEDPYGNPVYVIQPQKKKFIPVVTLMIIIANTIAFFLCIGVNNYFQVGGVNYEYVTKNHEYGRLVSYMFLHANLQHIVSNMVALWFLGGLVEEKLGSLRTAIIYFGSGVGAAIVSMNMYHMMDPDKMHFTAGASGAVFGIMCAAALVSVKGEKSISGKDVGVAIAIVVVYALFTMGGNVDVYAHIGGAILGGLLAFALHLKRWENYEENLFLKILAIILTVWCCIMGIGEARIGRDVTKLPDEDVEFVLEQPIIYNGDVTFEEGFESYCRDCEWDSFTSTSGEKVVEFHGKCTYKNSYSDIMMQVVINETKKRCTVWYIEIGGKQLNNMEINEFLEDVCDLK